MLAEQLVGEARARRARGMDPRERSVLRRVRRAVPAGRGRDRRVPARRARVPSADRRARGRLRADLAGPLRVRRLLRRARAARVRSAAPARPAPARAAARRAGRGALASCPTHRRQLAHGPLAVACLATAGSRSARCSCSPARARASPRSTPLRRLRRSPSSPSSPATSAWTSLRDRCSDRLPLPRRASRLRRHRPRRRDPRAARVRDHRWRRSTSRSILLAIGPLVWLLQIFSQDRARALRGDARAAPRLPRHGDAALRRRRVRRQLHGRALALGRRPGQRRRRRAGHRPSAAARSSSSPRCCTTSARSRSPRRSSTSRPRSPTSEFEVMKTHTIEGQFMLDRVGGLLARVGEIVRSCHERWDGSGYPDGLARRGDPARPRGSSSAATPTTR